MSKHLLMSISIKQSGQGVHSGILAGLICIQVIYSVKGIKVVWEQIIKSVLVLWKRYL